MAEPGNKALNRPGSMDSDQVIGFAEGFSTGLKPSNAKKDAIDDGDDNDDNDD